MKFILQVFYSLECKNTGQNTITELGLHPITFSLCRKQASTEQIQGISEAEVSFLKA